MNTTGVLKVISVGTRLEMTNNEPTPNRTYKLEAPGVTEHAIYFTIVGGDSGPEAFFVNSKEVNTFEWVSAIMTSYSRQIKAGVPVADIITDMKETFDPKGKYVIPDGSGREVNSVVHHLGLVLEKHIGDK